MMRTIRILRMIGSGLLIAILLLLILLVHEGELVLIAAIAVAINAMVLWFCATTGNFHVPPKPEEPFAVLDRTIEPIRREGKALGQRYWLFGIIALLGGFVVLVASAYMLYDVVTDFFRPVLGHQSSKRFLGFSVRKR